MIEAATETKAKQWPYISFKTLLNLIQKFEAQGGQLPPRIDRSVLTVSEGQKTQVIAALRFLGLVRDDGSVTPLFQDLVLKEKERKGLIREMLSKHYPEATALGNTSGTSKQLADTFDPLGADTLRKAMTFYIHAAKFAGHPLSSYFKTPTGFRPNGVKKPKAPKENSGGGSGQTENHAKVTETPATDAKTRYIEMLLDKASKEDKLDTSLLDRIEKLLGYPTDSGKP